MFARRQGILDRRSGLLYDDRGGRRGPRPREFLRRPIRQRAVGAMLVVFYAPRLDFPARIRQVSNQLAFKHSSRKRPLKLSIKLFWTGLPG